MELDHVIAKSKGGAYFDLKNIKLSHGQHSKERCNQHRNNKHVNDYQPQVNNLSWFQ